MGDDLFADIYDKLCEDLSRAVFEDQYGVFYEVDQEKLDEYKKEEFSNPETIIFNLDKYLTDILKSYKYDSGEIWNQFLLDFPRTNVTVQNREIRNYQQVFEPVLERIDQEVILDNRKYTLRDALALICNQSSYAFPFIFIFNLYADREKGLMLCSESQKRYVRFFHKGDTIQIKLEATFTVRDVNLGGEKPKMTIDTVLTLDLFLGKPNLFQDMGILKWTVY